ncbi:MAG: DNA/RNA non-specific endonuclease, partial [Alistipes sp.]|nr:DNA/RNA non-specific endonuclease [Alistipes sp.]
MNCNTTTNRIIATGDAMDYVATILGQEVGAEAWCSFSSFDTLIEPLFTKTGQVGTPMMLYLRRNETDAERTAQIDIRFADGTAERLVLLQGAFSETADYDRRWGEQPAFRNGDTYIYKTYYTTLTRGGYVRNYSICFDTAKRVSHWVAYPLTTNYLEPSVNRTNAWSYDPNDQLPAIPQSAQSDPTKTYGTGDARGHQCPSADRYSNRETNAMTFYAPNIMPQNYAFNGGIWVELENKIRSVRQLNRRDTLFVVTGTFFATDRT